MWIKLIGLAAGLGLGSILIKFLISAYKSHVLKHIQGYGRTVGRWISSQGRKRMGKEKWEKMEDEVLSTTMEEFTIGLREGWNSDDKQ